MGSEMCIRSSAAATLWHHPPAPLAEHRVDNNHHTAIYGPTVTCSESCNCSTTAILVRDRPVSSATPMNHINPCNEWIPLPLPLPLHLPPPLPLPLPLLILMPLHMLTPVPSFSQKYQDCFFPCHLFCKSPSISHCRISNTTTHHVCFLVYFEYLLFHNQYLLLSLSNY